MEEKRNWTYILRCGDGTLYTGWTNDLTHRVKMHNAGRGARYTRARRPVTLVWCQKYPTREEAMRQEAAVKKMSRMKKLALIKAGILPAPAVPRPPARIDPGQRR